MNIQTNTESVQNTKFYLFFFIKKIGLSVKKLQLSSAFLIEVVIHFSLDKTGSRITLCMPRYLTDEYDLTISPLHFTANESALWNPEYD